jgi:hypothetical protein
MRVVRSHPTAGQATLDYIAAVALVAAMFLVAAPAVGAPDLGRAVFDAVKHGICVAGGDICTNGDARRAGLAPCPLQSDTTGWEGSISALVFEVGGRWTLTVTPQSDGRVSVVRTAGVSKGAGDGAGVSLHAGPLTFDLGVAGDVRQRVQAARAWEFADQATADRFLEHSLRNAVQWDDWPASWHSVEKSGEISAMVGVALGGKAYRDRGDLVGVSGFAQHADGARLGRGGSLTLYGRTTLDGPELSLPFMASVGRGRDEWLVEYTVGRELVFRHAEPQALGNKVTETIARLDLRDPANLAAARPLLEHGLPWPPGGGAGQEAVMRRIATHGVIERTVSEIDDDSKGASGSIQGGLKLGASARKVKVRKQLVQATVQRGALTGARLDCVK